MDIKDYKYQLNFKFLDLVTETITRHLPVYELLVDTPDYLDKKEDRLITRKINKSLKISFKQCRKIYKRDKRRLRNSYWKYKKTLRNTKNEGVDVR